MTLTTHALVGAATAKIFSFNPVVAFLAAFLSHFVIDAIPHWDYKIFSQQWNKEHPMKSDIVVGGPIFMLDVLRVGIDCFIGIYVSIAFFAPNASSVWIILCGAVFGILPDPLQFAYFKIRREPLTSLQRFHVWIHSKNESLRGRWVVGSALQMFLVVTIMALTNSIYLL